MARGWTGLMLVQLLVAIAVTAILAAAILWVSARARAWARRSQRVVDERQAHGGRSAMGWWQVGLGLALAATAVVVLIHSGLVVSGLWYWGAVMVALSSLTLVVSGLSALTRPGGVGPVPASARRSTSSIDLPAPRLAALAERCGLITAEQREEALALQSKSRRPMGDVLCEQGLITADELERLLGLQSALREPWRQPPGEGG